MSDIQFNCPKCGHNLVVDAAGAGMSVPCPECSEPLIIPGPEEQTAAQVNNATAGVDTVSAVDTATSEPPLDKPMADGQTPRRSSAARGAAHVFWILFKWVAMAACLIGWLINVAVRWIVVLPTLKARLARRYRKIGAQAYRNKIDEENGSEIREQLLAIDHDSQVSGAPPAEGHKSQSGLALFVARGMRRRRMKRLYAMLGKDLAEGEAVSDSLSRHTRCATRTKQGIERIRAARPKIVTAGNFVLGMALVGVAAALFYFRGDIPRLSIKSARVASVAPRESDVSIHASSEPIFDVAPTGEVLPASVESSDADILSDQELRQLLKTIGRLCVFNVVRKADVEKLPNWVYSGSGAIQENAWEIYNIVSFEPEWWKAADPGILVTGHISFERAGDIKMWIREKRQIPIEDKNGFRRNLTVYELSPDEDVKRYERHLAAVFQKSQAVEAARQNEQQAVDNAKKEEEKARAEAGRQAELAEEKKRVEAQKEFARQALHLSLENAAKSLPQMVKLPEIHVSKKLAAKGFAGQIYAPRHDELQKYISNKDWEGLVRFVGGKLEKASDVGDALYELGGRGAPDVPNSWWATVEVKSSAQALEGSFVDYKIMSYIKVIRLPAAPENIVEMNGEKLFINIPENNFAASTGNRYAAKLPGGNGYSYKIPLGGDLVFFCESPLENSAWANPLLQNEIRRIEVAVADLNQKFATGQITADELHKRGIQLAKEFYQFVSGTLMVQY